MRERLLLEITRFTAADRARVTGALALASRLHAGDRRQREPYASHLLRVAIRILSHYRVTDPDVTCAALLHDSVEDHADDIAPYAARQAAFVVLARQFGERTAGLVAAVTNPVWETGRDEHQQYREHVAQSLEAVPWARVIKVSDFTDNAVGLFHTTGPKLSKLASKYRPLAPVLRELILRPDTPLDQDVKDSIVGQLDRAEDRFAAILNELGGTHPRTAHRRRGRSATSRENCDLVPRHDLLILGTAPWPYRGGSAYVRTVWSCRMETAGRVMFRH